MNWNTPYLYAWCVLWLTPISIFNDLCPITMNCVCNDLPLSLGMVCGMIYPISLCVMCNDLPPICIYDVFNEVPTISTYGVCNDFPPISVY